MTENMITVIEIAKATGLTRQAIYDYEHKGLITPAQTFGKYRMYSPDAIATVKKIQELKKDYHLPKIKQMLDEGAI